MKPTPQTFVAKTIGGGEARFLLADVVDLFEGVTTHGEPCVIALLKSGKRLELLEERLMVTVAKPAVVDRLGTIARIKLAQKQEVEG